METVNIKIQYHSFECNKPSFFFFFPEISSVKIYLTALEKCSLLKGRARMSCFHVFQTEFFFEGKQILEIERCTITQPVSSINTYSMGEGKFLSGF